MPLPPEHIQERLHFAYVEAVAAKAGANFVRVTNDYGADAMVTEVVESAGGKFSATSTLFSCQLKATTRCTIKEDEVVYDMDVEAYNKLVNPVRGLIILILLRLPKDGGEWLNINEDAFCMKHCCYWIRLKGDPSSNVRSRRIKIPRHQLFDPQAVAHLLELARQEDGYA